MARIYLARIMGIEGFAKTVVLKRILPELSVDADIVRMFLDEARLAAVLDHPNIVQVFDVGIVGGSYFYAMEFVEGQDVRKMLRRTVELERTIPLAVAIAIVRDVCAGLHYAHEQPGPLDGSAGIIHRDVSPSNVLVSYQGAVKLTDFGVAQAAGGAGVRRRLIGKPSYMSPEQCLNRPLDRRSDLFSAAILLYELTTRQKLYGGRDRLDIMRRIVCEPLPRPTLRWPDYPPALEHILQRGLAKNPDDRFASCEQMQLELESFAQAQRLALEAGGLASFMAELFGDEEARKWTPPGVDSGSASALPDAPTVEEPQAAHLAATERSPRLWPRFLVGLVVVLVALALAGTVALALRSRAWLRLPARIGFQERGSASRSARSQRASASGRPNASACASASAGRAPRLPTSRLRCSWRATGCSTAT